MDWMYDETLNDMMTGSGAETSGSSVLSMYGSVVGPDKILNFKIDESSQDQADSGLTPGGSDRTETSNRDRGDERSSNSSNDQQSRGRRQPRDGKEAGAPLQSPVSPTQADSQYQLPEGLWMIPCVKISATGSRAIHMDVSGGMADVDMFKQFRKERSQHGIPRWKRLLWLLDVTKIQVVRFNLMGADLADILTRDTWPDKDEWEYKPRPLQTNPPIGSALLLHLWHNPEHHDWKTYKIWLATLPRHRRFWEACITSVPRWLARWDRTKHFVEEMRERKACAGNVPAVERSRPPGLSSYAFRKLPKKKGLPLEIDDYEHGEKELDTEGWGLLLEEGFSIPIALFFVCFIYVIVSTVVMAFMMMWALRNNGVQQGTLESAVMSFLALAGTNMFAI